MCAPSAKNFEESAAKFKAAAEALRTAAPEAQEAAKRKLAQAAAALGIKRKWHLRCRLGEQRAA
eukprot:7944332-Pyramimonas_sp.AAC.1